MIHNLSFTNTDLLTKALTHRSATKLKTVGAPDSNERLEFLGDAVLELATTEFLFDKYPQKAEGELTAYRSALVKTTMLAEVASELDLGSKIYMSNGEESSGGRSNPHLLADTFEAVVGALYLDQGYAVVVRFLQAVLFPKITAVIATKSYKDAKSILQEHIQSQKLPTPTYEVIDEVGPDHDKEFTVRVLVEGTELAIGAGKSKQQAQQNAAEQALAQIADDSA